MQNTLDRIVAYKRQELIQRQKRRSLAELKGGIESQTAPRDFLKALQAKHPMALIAEVKKASPSAGLIRDDFDPVAIAQAYERAGAACISVLTDEHFFQGSLDYLSAVKESVAIPVLRKDFILDPYQVYEARAAGADAILLIAECLTDIELSQLHQLANQLGMQTLIEVYDEENIGRVLQLKPPLMGVNNRNLQTFETDLSHTIRLRESIPIDVLLVGESGIHHRDDVVALQSAGSHAILVGESLMRSSDIESAVHNLLGTHNDSVASSSSDSADADTRAETGS